ncbi:MAG TPA: hypothetical protein VF633_01645 [Brevundimonas sp.]|jgi:sarcosine oxidase gamma subunit
MRRRDLIAAGTAVALSGPIVTSASFASASDKKAEGEPAVAPAINLPPVGLPVIVNGRIRNYVFISLKLHLGGEATAETVRARLPFLKNALVRTAHTAPFTMPDDWALLSENKIKAAVMAIAGVVAPHSVTACEVLTQVPRRRTGMKPASSL